jgi:hypothetical protein
MNKPVFRVVGLDHSTCDDEYLGAETSTGPNSTRMLQAHYPDLHRTSPQTVQVQLSDVLPALQASLAARLAWVQDFKDDPIVITKDLYEVILSFQRFKNAA